MSKPNYKELQKWGRERKRQILVHNKPESTKPGAVLRFSDGTRMQRLTGGQLVRI